MSDLFPTPLHKYSFVAIMDDIAMMLLALVSALLLLLEFTLPLSPEAREAFVTLDLLIAFVFCLEFVIRFTISRDRVLFMKRYWWELLAAIPLSSSMIQAFRLLRLLRVVRLFVHLREVWHDARHVGEYRIT
jgi:voltage-gated potassium channel